LAQALANQPELLLLDAPTGTPPSPHLRNAGRLQREEDAGWLPKNEESGSGFGGPPWIGVIPL